MVRPHLVRPSVMLTPERGPNWCTVLGPSPSYEV